MLDLRNMKKLLVDKRVLHYIWLVDDIIEAQENAPWFTKALKIYNKTLKFGGKNYWSIVRKYIIPTTNDSTLGINNACVVATFMAELELNISQIITNNIRDKVL